MRKLLLLALLFMSLAGLAQEGPIPGALIDVVPSAPSGPCFQDLPDQQVAVAGALYSCQNGTWALIAGGGGGGFPNPMTTPGDMIIGLTGGTAGRLPANSSAGQAILVGTSPSSTVVPTAKQAAAVTSGSGNTTTATWSASPAAGESLFCTVFNSGSTATFTLQDNASGGGNTYFPYGSVHFGSTTNEYTQTFYTNPIVNAPTTTTVTANANGSFLTLQCDSASNILASSPTDGQQSVDVTSGQLILGTPITTTVGGDYIYCAAVANFAVTLSAGPGYTAGASSNVNVLNQYGTQGTAGAISPSMGTSSNIAASMTCSAFKAGTAVTPASTAWGQRVSISDIQAYNTDVLPFPPFPSGGDDFNALQLAVNLAIGEGRELYIPAGAWHTSATVIANSNSFRMRGNSANDTSITATGNGYGTFSVGTGSITAINPGGYVRDIAMGCNGKPAVGSPTGVAALTVNAMTQYEVSNFTFNFCDVGLDVTNNSFGANWHNIRGGFGGNTNVGLYLRAGGQSGSDLSFYDLWIDGAFCGVCIAGGGGGYHFYSGQINAGQNTNTPNDNAGAMVLNYDYLTGSTAGSSDVDIHGTSFEGTTETWIFRNYGSNFLFDQASSINPSSFTLPAIGIYKGTGMGLSRIEFNNLRLTGYFSNAHGLSFAGSTLTGPILTEIGTESAAQNPEFNGVSAYVDNMAWQSGLQGVSCGSDQVGLNCGGIWITNNGGTPQYSSNHGGTWTNAMTNPMNAPGQIVYGASAGAPAALSGNPNPTDEVYVSHGGGGSATPDTYTCGAEGGASTNPVSCTFSTSPGSGKFIACGVYNDGASTLSVTDSAGNIYSSYGSEFAGTLGDLQLFYFGPLSSTITTVSASSTAPSFLGIQCNSVANVVAVPDGTQVSGSGTSSPITVGPLTTTANGAYVFCSGISGIGDTLGAGSGFTAGSSLASNALTQYQVQATAGAISPTMTVSNTQVANLLCGAFKAGSAAAPTLKNAPALSTANMNATALKSGTSSNSDSVGVLTLSGGSQTYTFSGTYATAPVCTTQDRTTATNTSHASATTTVLTVTGTGTDAVGYICMGLN